MFEKHDAVGFGAFLLVYGHLLRGIELGKLYAFGDFPPYYGLRAVGKFGHTWHEWQLGYSYLYNTMPAYMGVVTGVGGALAQNLVWLALLPLGFLSFLVLAKRFIDNPVACYLASGVYALNPVTINEFVNGGIAPLVGFVGFPLVVHYLYAIEERDSWGAALKAAVVFGATNITVWLTFWMLLPFALYFGLRVREDREMLSKFAGAGALGVILSLPSFHHALQRVGGLDGGQAILFDSLQWSYAEADVLSVLRLAGTRGRAMNALGYNQEPLMAVGLVIPLMAVFSTHRRDLRLFHAIIVTITGFLVLTGMGLTYPLFDLLPPLWSVRNPVKLQYPLMLSLALVFGSGVERIQGSGLTDPNIAIVGLLVLSLFAYAMPAQGALGLDEVRGDDYYVSEDERIVAERLEGRVLWVPYGYTTQLHLRDVYPEHVGIRSGGSLHGIQNTEFVADLFADFSAGEPVADRLANLGVRYVVVSKRPPDRYGGGAPRMVKKWGAPWIWGEPAAYRNLLERSPSYELAYENSEYAVYEVAGSSDTERVQTYEGLHTVRYPDDPTVERTGPNLLENPSFSDGTQGWWVPPETEFRTVEVDPGQVELLTEGGANRLPVAQSIELRPRHPYGVTVDADGPGEVHLFWYQGSKSPANLVAHRVVPLNETPLSFTAKADVLSIRIKPAGERLVVREVQLYRTTYPPATSPGANAEAIPGVTVYEPLPEATVVASNTPDRTADVHVTDAETVLEGELVFDDRYRQGVAIVPVHNPVAGIPDDARVVTYDDGRVIDYWVTGEFDDANVTVVRSSYDERWRGPPNSTHVEAFGWANGFTNASAAEIRPPPNRGRATVVNIWTLAWLLTLVVLGHRYVRRRRQRQRWAPDDGTERL